MAQVPPSMQVYRFIFTYFMAKTWNAI